ncbi:ATP-dependent Clp protease proteolytic subunit [Salmonella bongori]|nr:ATP-dependent Clp protease proteolytic subunit [Salmonella bongori]
MNLWRTIRVKSLEQIERDTERDRFLSAPEAVEYGLVDSILTHRN